MNHQTISKWQTGNNLDYMIKDKTSADKTSKYSSAPSVLTFLFMWGFITCLNDVIIRQLSAAIELNYTKAMFVQYRCFVIPALHFTT